VYLKLGWLMILLRQKMRCELASVPDHKAEEEEVMCRTFRQLSLSRWAVSVAYISPYKSGWDHTMQLLFIQYMLPIIIPATAYQSLPFN
jgi:hypothetical protein